jgi:hypothetical protein
MVAVFLNRASRGCAWFNIMCTESQRKTERTRLQAAYIWNKILICCWYQKSAHGRGWGRSVNIRQRFFPYRIECIYVYFCWKIIWERKRHKVGKEWVERRGIFDKRKTRAKNLVPLEGSEPIAFHFPGNCSTNWATYTLKFSFNRISWFCKLHFRDCK